MVLVLERQVESVYSTKPTNRRSRKAKGKNKAKTAVHARPADGKTSGCVTAHFSSFAFLAAR